LEGLWVRGGEGREVSEVNHKIFMNPPTRDWTSGPEKRSIEGRSVGLVSIRRMEHLGT